MRLPLLSVKSALLLALIIALVPPVVCSQQTIDAPVWNVGEEWFFTGSGSIKVIKADRGGYILKFSERICVFETKGCETLLFEVSTLNRINILEGEEVKPYAMGLKKILDFPVYIGKKWNFAYSGVSLQLGERNAILFDYSEIYSVLGWEEVEVQAGKFKTLKIEYRRIVSASSGFGLIGEEITNHYWYAPNVKYFVKCRYDQNWMKGKPEIFNWELLSLQLKK